MLAETYSMSIKTDEFYPHFRGGETIFVQKGVAPSEFNDGDRVIYQRADERGVVREVSISADMQVTLKALSPGKEDMAIHFKSLYRCDKVIGIRFN